MDLASAPIINQVKRARQARAELVKAAREHPALFAQLVLKDEKRPDAIKLAPVHREWHRLANQHDRLIIWAHKDSGKSTQMAVGRTLWEIGRNPNIRCCILSSTHEQAEKIIGAIKQYLEASEIYKEIFPEIKPGRKWTDSAISVHRTHIIRDATVRLSSYGSKSLLGSRIDLLIIDDVLDPMNTRTPEARTDVENWIKMGFSRLTEHARVIWIGSPFHPEDAMYRTAKLTGWRSARYPIMSNGVTLWPEHWPATAIEKARSDMGPLEFARQMMCVPRDDASSRFERSWIERSFTNGKEKLLRTRFSPPDGVMVVIGVDLAVKEKDSADETVIFTIAVTPDGTREVLSIEAGHWTGPMTIEKIYSSYTRFGAHKVMVESNAAQEYIIQFANNRYAMPVKPFYTTAQRKLHPEYGIESLAAEMANGKWVFPSYGERDKELLALEAEMLYYDPRGHTGDRLMAMFFAREGAREGMQEAEIGTIDWNRR